MTENYKNMGYQIGYKSGAEQIDYETEKTLIQRAFEILKTLENEKELVPLFIEGYLTGLLEGQNERGI